MGQRERPAGMIVDLVVLVVVAVVGLSLWVWADRTTDSDEAWDSDAFWSVVLPAMLAASAVAGFVRPGVVRYVGAALVVPQVIALFAAGESGPLVVVGILLFLLMAGFFTAIALIGAGLRSRLDARRRQNG